MDYKVCWSIDIPNARSALDAAQKAREIQLDPNNDSQFFIVTGLNTINISPESRLRKGDVGIDLGVKGCMSFNNFYAER